MAPSRRLRDVLAGLFAEALELERRRHRRFWACALLVGCVVAGVALVTGRGGGQGELTRVVSGGAGSPWVLGSRTLPALGSDPLLSIAGRRLVVSDTDNTRFVDGRVTGICPAVTVDPASLRVISIARGNCGDPGLFDQHVIAITYVPTVGVHAGRGVNALAIRISVAAPSGPGYHVGPVIVTYPDGSDTRAETIVGDGSLWVYAPFVGSRLSHGELLRVSLISGRVLQRWSMPPTVRMLLATDADGLWLAPSNESGYSEHATAAQRIAQESLYHVAPGMVNPARVFDVGNRGARWLIAHGHSVWLARGSASRAATLWRFVGPTAVPTLRGAPMTGGVQDCGDLGDGPVSVVGSAADLFCVTNPNPNTEQVLALAAAGGHSRVVARIPTGEEWDFVDNAVLDHGGYYFVEAAQSDTPQPGAFTLFRVARRSR